MSRLKIKSTLYLLILLSAFLLIFIRPAFFTPLKIKLINAAAVPIRVISFPFKELKKMIYYHRTFNEYIRLRKETKTLKGRLMGMEELMRENSRLKKLLKMKNEIHSSIVANVIVRDPTNWNASVVIDKGHESGIIPGMPVVNAMGVVGKVAETGEGRSKVILASDPSFSVVALDQRSREVGLISGTLQGLCRMRYLSKDADIQMGDEIITSKLSSSFPEGLIVGKVIDIHRHGELEVDVIVEPHVPLSQIEEVLVIQKAD